MRIIILDTYYRPFLEWFYHTNPGLSYKNYLDTKKLLLAQSFGTADFYSRNLKPLGYEAEEIIIDDRRLQMKWARENQIKIYRDVLDKIPGVRVFWRSNWLEKILEQQIYDFDPDVIYCQSLYLPGVEFIRKIQKRGRRRLIVGQIASGVVFNREDLDVFDLILTSFPHYVPRFLKIGINSEYFRIGFEDTILKKMTGLPEKFSAAFVGGFSRQHLATASFLKSFEYLAKKVPVDFWGYGVKNLPQDSAIRKSFHGEAWGLNMYNILFNAKISINRHISAAENFANNMRLYESTGVGSMLITDYKDNLGELFKIGKEVETYRTKEELADKIKYFLSHDKERESIARSGQKRTLKDHTYRVRMQELSKILKKYI